MARTIKPNRQFFGVSVDTPAGNTQVTSEMLQGLSSVEQRVAALTNTAFDVVDVQMKEQGKQDAIDNPIDLQEWLQSSPKERKNIIKGNTITTKGMATRNMQISLLSSEMEVVYDTAISKLYNEAIKQKISYNDFAAGARDIQAGLLQSLEGTDADTQTKFLGNTNTTNNAYLKSFAAKELDDFQIAQKAKVNLHMSEFLNTKLKVVLSDAYKVRTVNSQTGETTDFSFDEIQDELLEKEVNILIDMRASSEQINSFITKYREKVTQYKKDLLFTRLDTDENREVGARFDAVQGVVDGTFGGNKDSQALYNSLTETEQEDFLKKSIDWAERLNKVTEENAKQKDRVFAETVDTLKTQLLVLETDKTSEMDLVEVYNIKDRLSVIMSPDDFIKFEKTIDAKIDSGIFIDPGMKKIIEESLSSTNTSVGGAKDDGPRYFFGDEKSYKGWNNRQAAKLGFEVVDYIFNPGSYKMVGHETDYPKGPTGAVTYFPAGSVGQRAGTNIFGDSKGLKAFNLWDKHIKKVSLTLGYEFLDYLSAKLSVYSSMNEPMKPGEKGDESAGHTDSNRKDIQNVKDKDGDGYVEENLFTKDWWKDLIK